MKNFLNKQREITALLLYVTLIVCLVYFVILPLVGKINSISDQIQQAAMNQESVELHIRQLPKIQKQYQSLQGSGDLSNVLLDENKAVALIEKLEKLAENTNNKIKITVQERIAAPTKKATTKVASLAPKTLVDDLPSPDYLKMKIALTGDYNSAVTFIDRLEKFEYYADIIGIQINKYDDTKESRQALSNSGVFGGPQQPAAVDNVPKAGDAGSNALTFSLDIVFYTN